MIRSVLYLEPRGGEGAAIVDFYRRHRVLERACEQDGCLGAELQLPAGGTGRVLVTALWRDATAGAGDVYHIARGNRTRLYDIHFRKPTPLVPRADIVEIGGRLNYAGEELEPLDLDAVRAAARRACEEGFGAVAVAFLFSFLEPAHELEAE